MDMVSKSGQMELSMKVSGSTIKQREGESSSTRMETITKASGKRTKLMAMAYTFIINLELDMRDIGRMICSTDLVYKSIATETNTKVCLSREREMEKALTITQLERFTKEVGSMAGFRAMESVRGQMAKSLKDSGKIIKRMVKDCILGLMADLMKAIIGTIKNMVKEHTFGLMVESI